MDTFAFNKLYLWRPYLRTNLQRPTQICATGSESASRQQASPASTREARENADLFLKSELQDVFQKGVRSSQHHLLLQTLRGEAMITQYKSYVVSYKKVNHSGSQLLSVPVTRICPWFNLLFLQLTRDKYTSDFRFEDPVVKYDLNTLQRSITALRGLFNIDFIVHDQQFASDTEVATR